MIAFVLFIIIHLTMVTEERFSENMGNIVLGHATGFGVAAGLFALFVIAVIIVHIWATEVSLRRPRRIQNALDIVLVPVKWILFRKAVSKQQLPRSEISSSFRVNGYPPETKEYMALLENNFTDRKLKVYGLVERSLELSLSHLYMMHKQEQGVHLPEYKKIF